MRWCENVLSQLKLPKWSVNSIITLFLKCAENVQKVPLHKPILLLLLCK